MDQRNCLIASVYSVCIICVSLYVCLYVSMYRLVRCWFVYALATVMHSACWAVPSWLSMTVVRQLLLMLNSYWKNPDSHSVQALHLKACQQLAASHAQSLQVLRLSLMAAAVCNVTVTLFQRPVCWQWCHQDLVRGGHETEMLKMSWNGEFLHRPAVDDVWSGGAFGGVVVCNAA